MPTPARGLGRALAWSGVVLFAPGLGRAQEPGALVIENVTLIDGTGERRST